MQHRDQSFLRHTTLVPQAEAPPSLQNEVRNGLRLLRRQGRRMLLGALTGAALLGAYALAATPTFRASTDVALDPNALSVLDTTEERARKQDTPLQDSARVDSLVQVLQSDATLRRVVAKLHLGDDPEFNGSRPSVVKSIVALVAGSRPPPSAADKLDSAVATLKKNEAVERAAGTYIVTVAVLSKDPAKAAAIADAVADDYLTDQLRSDVETTRTAATWMKGRLAVLRDAMLRTQGAVAAFKTANAIATADGKSIDDLMLSNISGKLTDAIAQTAQAKAKLDRIAQVNAQDTPDLSVADALNDDVITGLRKTYLDLQDQATNIAVRYGQKHAAVVKLRAEAGVALASVRSELKRLEEATRSDYEIARKNEASTRDSLNSQFLKTADVGRSQVELQELDSAATTAQIAYEDLLKRYTETVQKESFPIVQARVLAKATPPNEKFKPKTALLVVLGAVGGLAVSLAFALLSELFDKRVYSRGQAERAAGVDCLGVFPHVDPRALRPAASFEATARPVGRGDLPWDYVVQRPRSVGAEAMRSIRLAFDQMHGRQGERVIGVTSSLPGEGKSTIAAGLAHLLGRDGARVLLIDADLRRATLTARLNRGARAGLSDVLAGCPRSTAIVSDPAYGIDFLAARAERPDGRAARLPGADAMKAFVDDLGDTYDYVVVDLPPLLPVVDVRSMVPSIDGILLVVAWGQTGEDVITTAIDTVPALRGKLLGLLLNRVRLNRLAGHGESKLVHHSALYNAG